MKGDKHSPISLRREQKTNVQVWTLVFWPREREARKQPTVEERRNSQHRLLANEESTPMFQTATGSFAIRSRRGIPPFLAVILVVAMAYSSFLLKPLPARAQSGPIVQNDFEDGTLQGWIPRGTAVLTNTTEAAATGTHSLKTTGRTAGFHGPSLNLFGTLSRGTIYQITASVRLVAGQPADTLKITMQRTPVGGSNAFD